MREVVLNNIFLLLLSEILILAINFYLTNRDVMAPSVMMSIMFVISTMFACFNIEAWKINFSFKTFVIIITGILCFSITEVVFRLFINKKHRGNGYQNTEIKMNDNILVAMPGRLFNYSLVLINIVILIWYYKEIQRLTGYSSGFSALLHNFRMLNTSDSSTQGISTILNQFLKLLKAEAFVYLYVVLGFVIQKKNHQRILSALLVLFTSTFSFVLSGGRGGLLQLLCAAIVFYYILWNQEYHWQRNLSLKFIKNGLLLLLVGIPVFYYSTFWIGRVIKMNMAEYISLYIGGGIALFDKYIKYPTNPPSVFGQESLVSVNNFVNRFSGARSYGYHLESRKLSAYVYGNVYTFFRKPFHDFGYVGMLVFTMCIALLFSYIYYRKIKGNPRAAKTEKWVLIYGYLYWWIVRSSIDQWSDVIISMTDLMTVCLIVLLLIITRVKVKMTL